MMKAKQELVQKLAQNQDREYTRLHFGLYLNEPILTKEQQEAFDTVISFLDKAELKIPVDLQQYLDEAFKNFDTSFVVTVSENINKAFRWIPA